MAHLFAKALQKRVHYSDAEKTMHLKNAEELFSGISEWKGSTEFEYIGLGQNCNASWYLKETGLKKASYPFDWIFTTPEIICHMIEDDFKTLLNKQHLVPLGMDAGHKVYHASFFGHRNPASSNSDFEFLERCVARWNRMMDEKRPVLFTTVVLNEPDKRKRFKRGFKGQFKMPVGQKLDDFEPMIQLLQSKNPNCKFLFIEQYTEGDFSLKPVTQNATSYWLRYSCKGSNSGVKYLNDFDDLIMKTLFRGS